MRPAAIPPTVSLRRSAAGSCAALASLSPTTRFDASLPRLGLCLLLHNAFDSCYPPIYLCALCFFIFVSTSFGVPRLASRYSSSHPCHHKPASDRSLSARLVFSQEKPSTSLRPKCPNAAVCL